MGVGVEAANRDDGAGARFTLVFPSATIVRDAVVEGQI
jgi:two-component system sensor histidine kinase KdpD